MDRIQEKINRGIFLKTQIEELQKEEKELKVFFSKEFPPDVSTGETSRKIGEASLGGEVRITTKEKKNWDQGKLASLKGSNPTEFAITFKAEFKPLTPAAVNSILESGTPFAEELHEAYSSVFTDSVSFLPPKKG